MKICDASYLIAFLHPNPNPPQDRQGKPVTRFRERISTLIEDLSAANDVIGIPAPALAETLVRSGPNRVQYMSVLGDSWRFQMVPFDSRAAIETAELIAATKTQKEPWDTWAKVKFDIQIVATAKAEGASVIYSDDRDIENFAQRLKIRVVRICDLPAPPPEIEKPIEVEPIGSQTSLFASPATDTIPVNETTDESTMASSVQAPNAEGSKQTKADNELKSDSSHPPTIQGSDGRRAQGAAARETSGEKKE